MKLNEVLQNRHKEEFASSMYRVPVDTKRVTPAMLFRPEFWEAHTILKKGDMLRCVADDGSFAFDLIVTSQKLDATKSVKNIVTVAMFPQLTDEVIAAAEGLTEVVESLPQAEIVATEVSVPVAPKPAPAFDTNISYGKRKEIEKRAKMLAKRKEIDERNKARTAERLAAEASSA